MTAGPRTTARTGSLIARIGRAAVGLTLAVAAGASAGLGLATSTPSVGYAGSSVDGYITRSEVLARAQYWVDQNVVYGTVYDSNGNVISTQTAPDSSGKAYRTDCSGLVSMAWHLSSSLTTSDFHTWPGATSLSSADDLFPGDAVLFSGHIELFARWKNSADHSQGAWAYSLNGPAYQDWAKGPAPNAHGQVGGLSWSDIAGNIRLRYNKIVDDAASARGPVSAVAQSSGTVDVFWKGTDGGLWHKWFVNGTWYGPEGLGGSIS
jgi:hypothetical protein